MLYQPCAARIVRERSSSAAALPGPDRGEVDDLQLAHQVEEPAAKGDLGGEQVGEADRVGVEAQREVAQRVPGWGLDVGAQVERPIPLRLHGDPRDAGIEV